MNQFLFGYGSLVNSTSRRLTGVTGIALPARVAYLHRRWGIPDAPQGVPGEVPKHGMTALAANFSSEAVTTNGVLLPVTEDQLAKFDLREEGYRRVRLDYETISALDGNKVPLDDITAPIWAYLIPQEECVAPSVEFPIALSYVEVVVDGFREISEEAAVEFLKTTDQWTHFIDDRHDPRYVRAMTTVSRDKVDALLRSNLPRGICPV